MQIALISVTAEFISIGLRTISSVLKREGHCVKTIFIGKDNNRKLTKKDTDSLRGFLKGFDLVGLSFTTNYLNTAIKLNSELKKDKNTIIIWGGIHPTVNPEECLDHVEYVCVGEGEILMANIANSIKQNLEFKDQKNLGYKKGDDYIINTMNPLIANLDTLPILDLDESNHFTLEENQVRPLKGNPRYERYFSNQYTIMASRGCPHKCSFCCNDFFRKQYPGQKYVRRRGIEKIIEELKEVKTRMPFIKDINFVDDFFLGNPPMEELIKFTDIYKKEIKLPFVVSGFSPGQCKEKMMELLIDAGMVAVRMGIQSGSEDVLSLFKRNHLTVEKILKSAEVFNTYSKKIRIDYDFILDLPWAREDDEKKTFDLLLKLPRPFNFIFYSFVPFPGTSLFEKAKEDGFLNEYKEKNYGDIQNSYFNSLIYLFEFNTPVFILNFLANDKVYKSILFKPFYQVLKSSTKFLKFSYISFYVYPKIIITGQRKLGKYEIKRGIDNLKKVMGVR